MTPTPTSADLEAEAELPPDEFSRIANVLSSRALYKRDDGTLVPVDLSTLPEPAPTPMLWGGRLAVGYPNTLYGNGGQGKSMLALGLAASIASGRSFCGLDLPSGPVVYLDWELSQDGQLGRAFKIARGLGLEKPPKGLNYLAPLACLPDLIDRAVQMVERVKPVLIVVDSMGPAAGGNPEDAEGTIKVFNAIRTLGVSTLILDHQSKMQQGQEYKGKTIFGSAYKFNLSRSVIHLERVSSVPGELRLMVRHAKSNFGPYADDLALLARFGMDAVKFEAVDHNTDPAYAKALTIGDKILHALRAGAHATAADLALEADAKDKTVQNELTRLRAAGKVKEVSREGRKTVWALHETIVPTSQLYMGGTQDALTPDEVKEKFSALAASERTSFLDFHERLAGSSNDPDSLLPRSWAEYRPS